MVPGTEEAQNMTFLDLVRATLGTMRGFPRDTLAVGYIADVVCELCHDDIDVASAFCRHVIETAERWQSIKTLKDLYGDFFRAQEPAWKPSSIQLPGPGCSRCLDNGYILLERQGAVTCERCSCRAAAEVTDQMLIDRAAAASAKQEDRPRRPLTLTRPKIDLEALQKSREEKDRLEREALRAEEERLVAERRRKAAEQDYNGSIQ